MAKIASSGILDALLTKLASGTTLTILSAQPTSLADITTYKLGSVALTAGAGGASFGAFTGASGAARVCAVAAITGISISANGTATYISIDDGTDFYATTCTSQAVSNGGTADLNTFNLTANQPV